MRTKTLSHKKVFGHGNYPLAVVWHIHHCTGYKDKPYISGEFEIKQFGDSNGLTLYAHGDDLKNVDLLLRQLSIFKASILKERQKLLCQA
jgi:hypothetical protein